MYSLHIKAQEVIPNTEIGDKVKYFVELFNSSDSLGLIEFMKNNMSEEYKNKIKPEAKAVVSIEIRDDFGKINPYSFSCKKNNTKIILTVCNRSMTRWQKIHFEFSKTEPNKISFIGYRLTSKPKAVKIPRLNDEDLAKELNKFVSELVKSDEFSGTILIAKNGKPIFEKAYGYADIDKQILNNLETKFALGSMNKMMTGLAIVQLYQEGKLDFNDLIIKYIPDYPNKEAANKITIRHLLTHTSGLGGIFTEKWEKKKDSVRNVQDWFEFFAEDSLLFKPGKKNEYSNAAYIVLGAIIEKISGIDYYTYIRKNITEPLGMKNTEFYAKTDIVDNMAEGYMRNNSTNMPQKNTNTRPFRGMPAGGGYSTVKDLLKFADALRTMKLLNKKNTETLITRKQRLVPIMPVGYGYGFLDDGRNGIRTVGHPGGAPGMCGELDIYWESGYTVIVLSNYNPPTAMEIAAFIRQRISKK